MKLITGLPSFLFFLFLFLPSPFFPSSSPPPLPARPPDQTLCADLVPSPQQHRHIHVQRAIRLPFPQKHPHRLQRAAERVRGAPVLARQQREADLARAERDVRMDNGRREADRRRRQGVRRRDLEAQVPEAGCRGTEGG